MSTAWSPWTWRTPSTRPAASQARLRAVLPKLRATRTLRSERLDPVDGRRVVGVAGVERHDGVGSIRKTADPEAPRWRRRRARELDDRRLIEPGAAADDRPERLVMDRVVQDAEDDAPGPMLSAMLTEKQGMPEANITVPSIGSTIHVRGWPPRVGRPAGTMLLADEAVPRECRAEVAGDPPFGPGVERRHDVVRPVPMPTARSRRRRHRGRRMPSGAARRPPRRRSSLPPARWMSVRSVDR